MQTASGLKNSQVLWELAQSADHDKMKSALYVLALAYAATNLVTAVDAALTPTFGTPFQINQNSLNGGNSLSTASLLNGKLVTVWSGNGNPAHVFGRTYFPNGTGFSNEFQVTSTPAASGVPVVAPTTNGFAVVWLNDTLSVAGRMYDSNGNSLTSPFPVQQSTTGYGGFGHPDVGNLNGTTLIAWDGAAAAGNEDTLIRVFSPNGTPLTGQSAINIGGSGTPSVIELSDGRALVTWYGDNPNSLFGNFVSANGTPSGSAFPINKTAITFDHTTKGAGLTGGSILTPYETASGNVGVIVSSQGSVGSQFSIGPDRGDGAAAAALTDGNAMTVLSTAFSGGSIQVNVFNPTGTSLTGGVTVPSLNSGIVPPTANGLSTGGGFIVNQDATTHKLMGVTVSFNVPPTPTVMPTSVPTSHPTSAPASTVPPTPAPASAATGLTPSLLTIPVVIGGYLANWWRG